MPRRFLAIVLASVLLLGIGGITVDHFFPGSGSPVTTSTTTSSTLPGFLAPTQRTGAAAPTGSSAGSGQLRTSLGSLMGLSRLPGLIAPRIQLLDSAGQRVALGSFRGKVVILGFFNARCDDICTVLAAEIHRAAALLGSSVSRIEFLTVNSDVAHLSLRPPPPAVTRSGLSSLSNWRFLSGTLGELNPVWKAYGVSISMVTATKTVSHNDVLYFIDPAGRLRYQATPFANESRSGKFSLPPATISQWASGIARTAAGLL